MEVVALSQKASFGLRFQANPTKTNVQNTELVGVEAASINLPAGSTGYSFGISFGLTGDTVSLVPLAGTASTADGATATATWSSTIQASPLPGDGDTFTVGSLSDGDYVYTFRTSATLPREVTIGASDSATRDNLMAAINNVSDPHPDVTASGGSGGSILLTANAAGGSYNAITVATSAPATWDTFAATMSGGSDGTSIGSNEADGKDFEGVDLPTLSAVTGILLRVTSGGVKLSDAGDISLLAEAFSASIPGFASVATAGLAIGNPVTIECTSGPAVCDITIVATPA